MLGWAIFGPIGGLIGFLAGSVFDVISDGSGQIGDGSGSFSRTSASGGSYSGSASSTYRTGQRNSFMMSLLVLATAVVRADGRISAAEMNNIKSFIRANFGDQATSEAESIVQPELIRR